MMAIKEEENIDYINIEKIKKETKKKQAFKNINGQ